MTRHPSKNDLFAYAEALRRGQPAIEAAVARHVKGCAACHREVGGIVRTLRVASAAPSLEPSKHFTAELMRRAQTQRQTQSRRAGLARAWAGWAKGLTYAACLALFAGLWFGGASGPVGYSGGERTPPAAPALMLGSDSTHDLDRATERVDSLSRAVARERARRGGSGWEAEYRRAVGILDADLEAALAAMQRNPGYARTNDLVHTNLERQVQTLKSLYLGRNL